MNSNPQSSIAAPSRILTYANGNFLGLLEPSRLSLSALAREAEETPQASHDVEVSQALGVAATIERAARNLIEEEINHGECT